ncbi:MAG: hypothetical protein ACEQSR_16170 [Candidatus Methylacidiphilales bacterium]
MKAKQIMLLLAATAATYFTSCKKDSDSTTPNTATPTCNITSTLENDTTYAAFIYNPNGTINQVINKEPSTDTSIYSVIYEPNLITVSIDGTPLRTYFLNSKGNADSIVTDVQGFFTVITNNTYDNNGYIKTQIESQTFLGSTTETTRNFTYTNGNLTTMEESDGTTNTVYTYDYFTDKTNNLSKVDLDYMFMGNSNKNLVKTEFTDGEITTNYSYNFDSNGKVTKKIATSTIGEVNQTNYSWTCK